MRLVRHSPSPIAIGSELDVAGGLFGAPSSPTADTDTDPSASGLNSGEFEFTYDLFYKKLYFYTK